MKKVSLVIKIGDSTDVNLLRLGVPNFDSNGNIRSVNSTHDFLLISSGYPALLTVCDEDDNQLFFDALDLIPSHSIDGILCAINGCIDDFEDEEEMGKVLSCYQNFHFPSESISIYKNTLENLKSPGATEKSFVLDLLKQSIDINKPCACEMGDLCDYDRLFITYDIWVSEEGFDPQKLDFFNIDTHLNCCGDINEAFDKDVIFLDTIIYDGNVYKGSTGSNKLEPNARYVEINPNTLQDIDE